MKTNGTRRIVTFMLALVLVFTTVCVGTTEVEAAEKFTTIIAPTQTEQATAGTEVKTPFSLTKSYGFVAQIVTEAPVDMTWDDETKQNFASWTSGDTTYSIWLEDEKSMEYKLQLMKKNKLAGTAEWALGQENSDIWQLIQKYVN